MNIAPIAGLVGAAVATMSVFKWIFVGLVGVFLLWMLSSSNGAKHAMETKTIKDLVKSSAQWNARALQDTNPLIGLMNANYALAYFHVARLMGSDADIEKKASIQVESFGKELDSTQSRFMHALADMCPSVVPSGNVATGWPVKTKQR